MYAPYYRHSGDNWWCSQCIQNGNFSFWNLRALVVPPLCSVGMTWSQLWIHILYILGTWLNWVYITHSTFFSFRHWTYVNFSFFRISCRSSHFFVKRHFFHWKRFQEWSVLVGWSMLVKRTNIGFFSFIKWQAHSVCRLLFHPLQNTTIRIAKQQRLGRFSFRDKSPYLRTRLCNFKVKLLINLLSFCEEPLLLYWPSTNFPLDRSNIGSQLIPSSGLV